MTSKFQLFLCMNLISMAISRCSAAKVWPKLKEAFRGLSYLTVECGFCSGAKCAKNWSSRAPEPARAQICSSVTAETLQARTATNHNRETLNSPSASSTTPFSDYRQNRPSFDQCTPCTTLHDHRCTGPRVKAFRVRLSIFLISALFIPPFPDRPVVRLLYRQQLGHLPASQWPLRPPVFPPHL